MKPRFAPETPPNTLKSKHPKTVSSLTILHVLVFAAVAVIVQQAVGVGTFHHLHQNGREFPLQRQEALCKGGRCHLDTPLIGRVDFQVVAKS